MKHIVVAKTKKGVIGMNGKIPWDFPEEMELFKKLTMGSTVIMGRKTYESLGKPLSGRKNIVLSKKRKFYSGAKVYDSLASALKEEKAEKDVYIIGGESLYKDSLDIADHLHISEIPGEYEGDTFFPKINWGKWELAEEKIFNSFKYNHYVRA